MTVSLTGMTSPFLRRILSFRAHLQPAYSLSARIGSGTGFAITAAPACCIIRADRRDEVNGTVHQSLASREGAERLRHRGRKIRPARGAATAARSIPVSATGEHRSRGYDQPAESR